MSQKENRTMTEKTLGPRKGEEAVFKYESALFDLEVKLTKADKATKAKDARIAELEAKLKWQPIETAPEALTTAIVYLSEFDAIISATYFEGIWASCGEVILPTHWMAFPDAPEGEQNDD